VYLESFDVSGAWWLANCCQVALKPIYEELDQKVPYGLLQSISVGIGDVVSDLLQKTLDNVSYDYLFIYNDSRTKTTQIIMKMICSSTSNSTVAFLFS